MLDYRPVPQVWFLYIFYAYHVSCLLASIIPMYLSYYLLFSGEPCHSWRWLVWEVRSMLCFLQLPDTVCLCHVLASTWWLSPPNLSGQDSRDSGWEGVCSACPKSQWGCGGGDDLDADFLTAPVVWEWAHHSQEVSQPLSSASHRGECDHGMGKALSSKQQFGGVVRSWTHLLGLSLPIFWIRRLAYWVYIVPADKDQEVGDRQI